MMQFTPQPIEADEIPLLAIVKTPLGHLAEVIGRIGGAPGTGAGYKGGIRGHRTWLICRYLKPVNRAFDTVQVLPELLEVVRDR